MTVGHPRPAADPRTPAQKEVDEAAARAAETGNWDGFSMRVLCTAEGARILLEHQQRIKSPEALAEVTRHPFRWKHHVFRITRCEFVDGVARVEATPHDPEFIAEVKKRIEKDRFHTLPFFQGYGFVAFPEDYLSYNES